MASAYGQALAIGMTVNDVAKWPERIEQVDAAGVKNAAAALMPKESVNGYLVPGKTK
jgi:zinc protease